MADENQAGKMILSHINLFNEAVVMFSNVIEPAVKGAIDECVQAFAKEEKWDGQFELKDENENCWLAPKQWDIAEKDDEPQSKAWFIIDAIQRQGDYLTALFCSQGSASGEAGFMFNALEARFGKKTAWNKSFLQVDSSAMVELKRLGFKVVENSDGKKTFFLPISIDSEKLAETWGNDGEFAESDECFGPIKDALEKIKMAWPIFDAILNAWPVKA